MRLTVSCAISYNFRGYPKKMEYRGNIIVEPSRGID